MTGEAVRGRPAQDFLNHGGEYVYFGRLGLTVGITTQLVSSRWGAVLWVEFLEGGAQVRAAELRAATPEERASAEARLPKPWPGDRAPTSS